MKKLLQTLCVIVVSIGIGIEIVYEADLGFLCITIGGLAFAISTKINDRVKIRRLKGGGKRGR